MKTSIRKFLISTTLAPCFASTAFTVEVIMPSENFDGSSGKIFPYTTLSDPRGTLCIFSGDLYIANLDNAISRTSSSCFSNRAGALQILGKGGVFSFLNIRSSADGAAISSVITQNPELCPLSFSGFSQMIFDNCESLTSDTSASNVIPHASAIYATTPMLFTNNDSILFQYNRSAGFGAAIRGTSITIENTTKSLLFNGNGSISNGGALTGSAAINLINNSAPVIFSTNATGIYGGAIYLTGGSMLTSGNLSGVSFVNNSARSGGAIYANGNVTFSNNSDLTFQNNTASPQNSLPAPTPPPTPPAVTPLLGYGGAIFCTPPATPPPTGVSLTISGENTVTFLENIASEQGGALYGKKISIDSNKSTIFLGNTAGKGGAIAIPESGELSLSANQGDILFNKNLSITSGASTRNSIHFGKDAKFATLGATQGYTLYFYDPITSDDLSAASAAATVVVNPKASADGAYSGTIVFSGETLTATEAATPANATSTLNQKLELEGGTLALRNGATLNVHSFTQDERSVVIMDAGTTLATTNGAANNTDGAITLNNLVINLDSLDGTKAAVVNVQSTNGALSISGTLGLVKNSQDCCDNHGMFNKDLQQVPILELNATSTTVTTTDFSVGTNGYQQSPYGYQGTWEFTIDTTNHKVTGDWKKTGYIPHPERLAPLIPNSLWANVIDLRAVSQASAAGGEDIPGKQLSITGITNFFHANHTNDARSYRHMGGGYLINTYTRITPDAALSLGFGQLFTKSKDYLVGHGHSNVYFATVYSNITKSLFGSSRFFSGGTSRVTYSRSNEKVKTSYTKLPKGRCSWSNNCWLGELEGNLPITLSSRILNLKQIIPFVKAEVAYATHGGIQENTPEGRIFGHGHLLNVAVPVGVRFDKNSHNRPDFYTIIVAYAPDVYRHNPNCDTTLPINGATWTSIGNNLTRSTLLVQASSHTSVNDVLEIFGHCGCDIRRTSRQYTLDIGSKLRF
ncbi:putative outer membrane protein 5 [Chlamydia pneumoniae LPCoLN]|uniref:Pmp family polymorphic membrane protein autotransporter adhesin n=1 Tax=Chlamydia pneumoniae TaxID=83558 RepID=UPI0001BD9B8D|nr:Pmp family polymorphic membrane protein autotransporter adhesin [Chlamydia pneumoniae]ACZ33434.1 putative outer membrane protein 5 [Chlamydia pneumoniae LPCoLN]ETR80359.1 polymorphic membrane protein G family [Chlamydia pneumoniae B21]